jgi:hypothetical protein
MRHMRQSVAWLDQRVTWRQLHGVVTAGYYRRALRPESRRAPALTPRLTSALGLTFPPFPRSGRTAATAGLPAVCDAASDEL